MCLAAFPTEHCRDDADTGDDDEEDAKAGEHLAPHLAPEGAHQPELDRHQDQAGDQPSGGADIGRGYVEDVPERSCTEKEVAAEQRGRGRRERGDEAADGSEAMLHEARRGEPASTQLDCAPAVGHVTPLS